jgi:GNAT superfamily N-acetyltransferase
MTTRHDLQSVRNRNTSKLKVRSAKLSDAKRIAELSTQLGYPVSKHKMTKLMMRVVKQKSQRIFAAELDGNVVGWLEIFLPLSILNSGKAEIGAVVVDHQFRRSGVGTALMNKAHEWAWKKHCPFIYLRSNIIRNKAHKFYHRTGYKVFKTQYVFRKQFSENDLRNVE